MRASRLLTILLMLQTRGRLTAQEIADEMEVSVRTVYRDIDALNAAGVPIYADRGPIGGYHLLDGYRTRLTGLTPDEAESLFLAGIPNAAIDLGFGDELLSAQLKLLASFPQETQTRATRIRERFHLDAPGWFRQADDLPFLGIIADAVWNQTALITRYRSWKGEVNRTLNPLGLILKAGTWYLAASVDDQPRAYRVSRFLEVEATDQTFTRPAGFDLASFWQEWSTRFEDEIYRQHATVRITPEGLRMAEILLGPIVARAMTASVTESAPEPTADGWIHLTIPIESIQHGLVALLQLGPRIEVLDPPELREQIIATARDLLTLYTQ